MENGFIIFVLHATNQTPKYPCQLYYSFLKNIYLYVWLHWALVAACRIFSCSTWALTAWSGIEPRSLHWEHGVLATGPSGKSQLYYSCVYYKLSSVLLRLKFFNDKNTITLSFINSLCFTLTLAKVSFISNRPEFVSSTNKENLKDLWKQVLQNIDLSKQQVLDRSIWAGIT